MGSCSLLQGIFQTQGLNLGLLHCRWILYCLSHQGISKYVTFITCDTNEVKVLAAQLCTTRCDPLDYGPPGSSDRGDSPVKNTGVCSHSLLQAIFQTQGLNLGLLHCRQILYCLSHQGRNPKVCVIYRCSINILINMLHIYGTLRF